MNIINVKNIAIIFSVLFSCAVHAANNTYNPLTKDQQELLTAIGTKSLQEIENILLLVNPNFCDKSYMSPLLLAITRQNKENNKGTEWIEPLFKHSANPTSEDIPANKYLLRQAALNNNVEAIKLLNKHGATYISRYEDLMQNEKICPEVKNELERIYRSSK